jgi:mRNA-degrading endonuclease RelE of RelBE toxin-antitoxin system
MKLATHKWHFTHFRDIREQIRKLPRKEQLRVYKAMEQVLRADNPKALLEVKKLVDSENQWRIRQGKYRIIFTIDTSPIEHDKHEYLGTIHFISVSHRKEAY